MHLVRSSWWPQHQNEDKRMEKYFSGIFALDNHYAEICFSTSVLITDNFLFSLYAFRLWWRWICKRQSNSSRCIPSFEVLIWWCINFWPYCNFKVNILLQLTNLFPLWIYYALVLMLHCTFYPCSFQLKNKKAKNPVLAIFPFLMFCWRKK